MVGFVEDQVYLANLSEHYARRSIKFCKSIDAFRSLNSKDQMQLMKSFYPEFTAIHMSFIYVEEKDCVRNETGQEVVCAKVDGPPDMTAKGYASTFRRFAFPLRFIMQNDTTIRNLLFAQLLFKPRDNTSSQEFINYNYSVYSRLLRKYLRFIFKSTGDKKFASLMDVLGQIGVTSKIYWNFFTQEFSPNELHEIVRDIFNIKLV